MRNTYFVSGIWRYVQDWQIRFPNMVRWFKALQGIFALFIAFVTGYLLASTLVRTEPMNRQVNRHLDHPMINKSIPKPSNGSLGSSTTKPVTKKPLLNRASLNITLGPGRLNYLDVDERMPGIDELYNKLVIVTAISDNHFIESKGIIATAQQMMPGKKIIVYDLGMNSETKKHIKSYCNVEYRKFPFKKYPKHVSKLLVYAWKPMIINITLNEFGAIYWGDAGNRFRKSLKEALPYVQRNHGYMTAFHSFDPKAHPVVKHQYYFTHPGMFDYFGINRTQYYTEANAAPHAAASRQLFINSTTVQTKIVQPLVQCALKFECISPGDAKYGPHRFDASALALIIYKNMKYEWTPEKNNGELMNAIVINSRDNGNMYKPLLCA